MAYVAEWQRLPYALTVMADAGLDEQTAKEALCGLIVDGKVKVRLTPDQPISIHHDTFKGANIKVPSHLVPGDFDWNTSRPCKPWSIGPRDWVSAERHAFSWNHRAIALIEVCNSDIVRYAKSIGTRDTREEARRLTLRDDTERDYKPRLTALQETSGRYPTRDEDEKWATEKRIGRKRVRELRRALLPPQVQRGGAPKRLPGAKPGGK
jgi:hypothetical protein